MRTNTAGSTTELRVFYNQELREGLLIIKKLWKPVDILERNKYIK